MNFELNDDQRLLEDSVRRLMTDQYPEVARRAFASEEGGWSRAMWSQYAELGLLGLPFSEADGGFGTGPFETMLVMQAFGRASILEPYLGTVVMCGTALALAGSDAQRCDLLPRVSAGNLILAFAHSEPAARYDLDHVATRARRDGSGWILSGVKAHVLHGDSADVLLVSARTAGDERSHKGISLFLVDMTAQGISRRVAVRRDDIHVAEIILDEVRVDAKALIGVEGQGFAIVERVVEAGIAATAAEAVGAMEMLQAMTLDYVQIREQFGRKIGANQVIQHRLAEMLISLEEGRSFAMLASAAQLETDPVQRAREIMIAKIGLGQAARFVSQQSVQVHGGIAMTEECAVGQYFHRIAASEHLFGDTTHHLTRLAALQA